MKKLCFAFFLFFSIRTIAVSENYTLRQCVAYAYKNKSSALVVRLDSAVNEKKVKEQIGSGLPQIEATGSLTDNVKISTQLMPGALMGKTDGSMIALKTGTQYNLSGALTLTQKVYDQSFWVALDAVKLNSEYSKQKIQKEDEQIVYDVANAYYKVVITQKQIENFKDLLNSSSKTLESLEHKYQNGAAKKIDVDKVKVSYNNSKSQLQQNLLNRKKYLNNLKYAIGMSINDSLNISDIDEQDLLLKNIVGENKENYDVENRIDYKMQNTNIAIQEISKKKYQTEYMPTVSFTANYGVQAMRDKFNFFDNSQNYYGSSYIALNVKAPIFSGFSTDAKVEQAELNAQIEKENLKSLDKSIKNDISNYYIEYKNAIENINNQKENMDLAQSVLKNTQLEFSQGKSSALELINAEVSLKEAQNNFYTQLLSLCLAELELEKQKGTITKFINNIKY